MGIGFNGRVLAGNQPIASASVMLYTAGTTGNGSVASQRLQAALSTDSTGGFSVAAGSYSCPVGASVLYVVAMGGEVAGSTSIGSSGTGSDSAVTLMTVPGACSAVASGANYVLNELTTVASTYALRPFLAAGTQATVPVQMGSSPTNTGGLTLGAATLASLVNLSTGTAPGMGFPSTGTAPSPKLNSLANVLHGCLVSTGQGSAACTELFTATASGSVQSSDTLNAALSIANHPGSNVGALYSLSMAAEAFTPVLRTAPADWTLSIAFRGGGVNQPTAVAIDSVGRVWVTNYVGTASLFSNTGMPSFPNGLTGYGLDESVGGAIDIQDRFWVTNQESDNSVNGGNGSVTVLDATGVAQSGSAGYSAGGIYSPVAVAFDTQDIAWILNYYYSAVTLLNGAGVPQSGAAGFQVSQSSFANAIAVDAERNGWIANSTGYNVIEIAPDGSAFTSYKVGAGPSAVAIDAHDNLWSANYMGDSIGLVSAGQVRSGNGFTGGGVFHPLGIAADGDGTVWVANYRLPGISELAGASASHPGEALSPDAGWAPDLGMVQAQSLAIDAAGNLWIASNGDNRLVEYVGMAAPVKTPLLGAARVP